MALTEDQITGLIRRHRLLGGEVAEIQAEMIAIKEQIEAEVSNGWKLPVDGITASKREANREFDITLAFGHLDPIDITACKREILDPKLVRELIEKRELLDSCMVRKAEAKAIVKL